MTKKHNTGFKTTPLTYSIRALQLALVTLLVVLASACATNPVTGNRDFVLMSEEQEVQLGNQASQQVLQQYTEYDDAGLQQYVREIGRQLAEKSHRDNLQYHFTVLDSPEINAFALPGGHIYITTGILAYLNSEAQLAGILGHEIGHITARHSVRQQSASTVTGLLGAVAAIGTGSREVATLTNQFGTALVRGYGREHELEADRLGAEYLARLGYDPNRMTEVVGVLKSQEDYDKQLAKEEGRQPRSYHGTFSTHPSNDRRLQEVVQAAEQYKADSIRPENRTLFLHHVNGMTFGSSARQGVLRGNRFYHADLNFTMAFPQGWQVENLPDRLLAIAPEMDAYMDLTLATLKTRQSPRQFLTQLLGGSPLSNGRSVGLENNGYTGLTRLNTPWGERTGRVTAIIRDTQAFVLIASAMNTSKFRANDPEFLQTAESLRNLKASERKLTEPKRIRIVQAQRGDTFASLADRTSLESHAEEQLRLLNGMYPDGEIEAGQLVKIIE